MTKNNSSARAAARAIGNGVTSVLSLAPALLAAVLRVGESVVGIATTALDYAQRGLQTARIRVQEFAEYLENLGS